MVEKLKVQSPYDLHEIAEYPMASIKDADQALATARRVFDDRSQWIPKGERLAMVERAADLVEKNAETFAKQAAEEGGKPLVDSRVELARAVQGIRESVKAASEVCGREIPMNLNAASANRWAFTVREPIGVCVSISAFNHPFNLIVHQVVPALAVGCPVIIKPAMTTPISCFNLVECLHEAGIPKEWLQAMVCDNDAAEKLVTDSRVDFFSFIGSSKVGWMLRSKLAPGTRAALEHGGAAPVIVESGADLDKALPLLVKGGYYHAGQVCVSVQRIFVHESISSQFNERLCALAQKLRVGDPLSDQTEVGPLILEREVDRVSDWVDEAKASGGKILTGGKKISSTCYEPTVVFGASADVSLSKKEVFGPVVSVQSYTDRNDAIRLANDVPYSFQASVFTDQLETAFDTVQKLNAAAVMVNDHTAFRVDWMPFAGRKTSGLGVGGMAPAMHEMTQEKLVVFKSDSL